MEELKNWIGSKIRTIKLPDLLIEVDNEIQFTRHFIPENRKEKRDAKDVCCIIAAIMAYGCNIGPHTMAQLTSGISYDDIRRVSDWQLYDETLSKSLADVVNSITALEASKIWGEGKTSSSDGQRFMFAKRVLQRTWSQRISDFAIEFYSFVADNYAPFYPRLCSWNCYETKKMLAKHEIAAIL